MNFRQETQVVCFHCERVITYAQLDSHFCFKGEIVSCYFDTAYPDGVIVFDGKQWHKITGENYLFLLQTPKVNTKKNNESDPDNLPVLDVYFWKENGV